MTAIESKAVFAARALALGIDAQTLTAMEALGWTTLGSFAFSCSYVPGQADDAAFKVDVLTALFGNPVNRLAAPLRRLYFEAYTLSAHDMKNKLERTGEDPPRKIPLPEREARFNKLSLRLKGVKLTGSSEPAHALVDTISQMIEDGTLKYIPWSDCQSRDKEIVSQKRDKHWQPDARGMMKEVATSSMAPADTTTDLKLTQALFRRGIACDLAQLMSFETHEKLAQVLLDSLEEEPMPGYCNVTLAQLQRADQEIFRLLATKTRAGLGPDINGFKPLEVHMQSVLDHTRVRVLLMPLPSGKSGTEALKETKRPAETQGVPGTGARAKKTARKAAAAAKAAPVPKAAAKAGSPKASGAPFMPMPLALRGRHSVTKDGSRICFGYNLGTCKSTVTNGKCEKGVHCCCGCFANHPLSACPSTASSSS